MERVGPALATATFLGTVSMLIGMVVIGSANAGTVEASSTGAELLWVLGWLGFGIVGLILVVRRPRRTLGWVALALPATVYTSLFLAEYAVRGLVVAPGSLPLALWAGWVGKWLFVPALGLVLTLVLLFPDERVEGRGMRRFAALVAVLVVVQTVIIALEPGPIRGDLAVDAALNPVGLGAIDGGVTVAASAVGSLLGLAALAIAVNAIVRARRAEGVRRQQFRWFAASVAAFPPVFVVTVLVSDTFGSDWGWDPVVLAFFFGLNAIAAAIGVAVTRHRLYEIDRVVSRTVAYTLVLGALGAVYVATVMALQAVLSPVTGGSDLAVAAATLAVAAAFGPVRRRLRDVADHRFNRSRYDASREVERFGGWLRDEVDLPTLAAGLTSTVSQAVQPRNVSLWLPTTGGGRR